MMVIHGHIINVKYHIVTHHHHNPTWRFMISEVAALLSSPPLSTRWTDSSIEETPSWPDHWSRTRWWRRCVWGEEEWRCWWVFTFLQHQASQQWLRQATHQAPAGFGDEKCITLEEKDKDKNNDRVFQVFFFWQTHWNFPLAENLGISRGLLSLTTTCWNFSQNVFTENFGISKGLLSFITTYHCITVWIYHKRHCQDLLPYLCSSQRAFPSTMILLLGSAPPKAQRKPGWKYQGWQPEDISPGGKLNESWFQFMIISASSFFFFRLTQNTNDHWSYQFLSE